MHNGFAILLKVFGALTSFVVLDTNNIANLSLTGSSKGQSILGEYVKVCEVSDVPPGAMYSVDIGDKKLMIVNVDGTLYAVSRICTHETADLSTGFLTGSVVTCPLHLSRFDVRSGEVENPPATLPIATYSLKVEGTGVYVQL